MSFGIEVMCAEECDFAPLPCSDSPQILSASDSLCVLFREDCVDSSLVASSKIAENPALTEKSPTGDSLKITQETIKIGVLERPKILDMFTNLPRDWSNWAKLAFTSEQIPLISAITISTVGLVVTDYETWQPFKKWYESSKNVHDMNEAFVFMGDGKFQFGIAVGFGIGGFIFDDTKALRTGSQITEVILACGGVVQLLKHLTGRESPVVTTTPTGRWKLFPSQIEYIKHVPEYDAFPSGHVATALATLTVIAENYPEQTWIKYVGYPAVGAIALGLVSTSIHWWSDFPLSIALGYSFGMVVSHTQENQKTIGQNSVSKQYFPSLALTTLSDGKPALNFSWKL